MSIYFKNFWRDPYFFGLTDDTIEALVKTGLWEKDNEINLKDYLEKELEKLEKETDKEIEKEIDKEIQQLKKSKEDTTMPSEKIIFNPNNIVTHTENADLSTVDTTGITQDIHTQELVGNIPTFTTFSQSRTNIENTLDKQELNDKVNYILQYFFNNFTKELQNATYVKSCKKIVCTLTLPDYTLERMYTNEVLMNQVAHKKAVAIILKELNSKGWDKIDVTYEVSKKKTGTRNTHFSDTTLIRESYIITVVIDSDKDDVSGAIEK